MNSIFNLFVIIPIINILLLAINFILAPHKPYKEKKTPFECGYHSFLSQNRTQFTVTFFVFALLFLMFDAEIVIIYPLTVSSNFNGSYGICVVILFVLILALGLVFELGKGALKINSKQEGGNLHSSFAFIIPFLPFIPNTYIIQQIKQSFFDFYTKNLQANNVISKVYFSGMLQVLVSVVCFLLCGILDVLSYANFSNLLTTILVIYYVYVICNKSTIYNWCYNLVNLLLVLFCLFVFWSTFFFVTNLICQVTGVLLSGHIAGEFLVKINGDPELPGDSRIPSTDPSFTGFDPEPSGDPNPDFSIDPPLTDNDSNELARIGQELENDKNQELERRAALNIKSKAVNMGDIGWVKDNRSVEREKITDFLSRNQHLKAFKQQTHVNKSSTKDKFYTITLTDNELINALKRNR